MKILTKRKLCPSSTILKIRKNSYLTKIDTNGTLVNFVGHLEGCIRVEEEFMVIKNFKEDGMEEGRKRRSLKFDRGEGEDKFTKSQWDFSLS